MEQIWKGVKYNGNDYSKRLEISNDGKLRNAKTKRVYKVCVNHGGYYQVYISLGKRKCGKIFKIHRCVAESFIPNPENYPIINHKDGNKLNNAIDNLEWCTQRDNIIHAIQTGLLIPAHGNQIHNTKLNSNDIIYIRENYKPYDKIFGSRALARKFNVDHSTILSVINRINWKHI